MKYPIQKITALSLITVFSLYARSASPQVSGDFEQALRELDIMSNIFEAASDQNRGNREEARYDFDEALYLANQGMLFSFRLGVGPSFFPGINISAGMPIEAIVEISRDLNEEFGELQREMFFIGSRNFGGLSEQQLEEMEIMSEAMEERQDNIRDLQRDLRDLQRRARDNDSDDEQLEAEIEALESQLTSEREQLAEQSDQYRLFMEDFRQSRQEELAVRNQALLGSIMNTLCDYGVTLRSLQDGEHVTIVLQNFNDNLDQIYVIDYADLANCSSGDALLQSALSYQL